MNYRQVSAPTASPMPTGLDRLTVWDRLWTTTDWRPRDEAILERERAGQRWAWIKRVLQDEFGGIRGLRVLELGCGRGDLSLLLGLEGASTTLLDSSAQALATAEDRFEKWGVPTAPFQRNLLDPLPSELGSFDVVLSIGVVEHFSGSSRRRAIDAHARSLKVGGVAIMSVPYAYCPTYRLWKAYLEARGWWPYGLERPYSRKEMSQLARQCGLQPLAVHTIGLWQSIGDQWARNVFHWDGSWEDRPSWLDRWMGSTLLYVGQKPKV